QWQKILSARYPDDLLRQHVALANDCVEKGFGAGLTAADDNDTFRLQRLSLGAVLADMELRWADMVPGAAGNMGLGADADGDIFRMDTALLRFHDEMPVEPDLLDLFAEMDVLVRIGRPFQIVPELPPRHGVETSIEKVMNLALGVQVRNKRERICRVRQCHQIFE